MMLGIAKCWGTKFLLLEVSVSIVLLKIVKIISPKGNSADSTVDCSISWMNGKNDILYRVVDLL